MSKTQYYTASSIDGFIADPDNSLQWLFESDSGRPESTRYPEFYAQVGAMAMGSTTYEWLLEHEDMRVDPSRWQASFGDVPSWVFSSRDLPVLDGARVEFVRGDVAPVHAAMAAAAASRNIWLIGGGDLVGQFADAGLLDELIIGYAPVTLGAGAPLLPRRMLSSRLRLQSVEQEAQFAYVTYTVHP